MNIFLIILDKKRSLFYINEKDTNLIREIIFQFYAWHKLQPCRKDKRCGQLYE